MKRLKDGWLLPWILNGLANDFPAAGDPRWACHLAVLSTTLWMTGDFMVGLAYSKTDRGKPDCRIMLDSVPARTGL